MNDIDLDYGLGQHCEGSYFGDRIVGGVTPKQLRTAKSLAQIQEEIAAKRLAEELKPENFYRLSQIPLLPKLSKKELTEERKAILKATTKEEAKKLIDDLNLKGRLDTGDKGMKYILHPEKIQSATKLEPPRTPFLNYGTLGATKRVVPKVETDKPTIVLGPHKTAYISSQGTHLASIAKTPEGYYRFFDPHYKPTSDASSKFNPLRKQLIKLVGKEENLLEDYCPDPRLQGDLPLCQLYAYTKSLYPELKNQQFKSKIREIEDETGLSPDQIMLAVGQTLLEKGNPSLLPKDRESYRTSGFLGEGKVCLTKTAFVKEHRKLINLLSRVGEEGKEQSKELAKVLKK
jgi:hypothetical protein